MVESAFVNEGENHLNSNPLSAFRALAVGFDRIAARPYLILPSIVLDLALWFGPHLSISVIFQEISSAISTEVFTDPAIIEQADLVRETLGFLGERYNILAMFSTLPAGSPFNLLFAIMASLSVGVPSLMAMRMPIVTPIGSSMTVELQDPLSVLIAWVIIAASGLGAGVLLHRWLILQLDPEAGLGDVVQAWFRIITLIVFGYGFAMVVMVLSTLIGSAFGLVYIGLPLLFVAALYLLFTPHGILRYGYGIAQSMRESIRIVRFNFFSTTVYVFLAFLIVWLGATEVWNLPDEGSWFMLLAILGHAFLSTMVLAGSYAFYFSRKSWTEQRIANFQKMFQRREE